MTEDFFNHSCFSHYKVTWKILNSMVHWVCRGLHFGFTSVCLLFCLGPPQFLLYKVRCQSFLRRWGRQVYPASVKKWPLLTFEIFQSKEIEGIILHILMLFTKWASVSWMLFSSCPGKSGIIIITACHCPLLCPCLVPGVWVLLQFAVVHTCFYWWLSA
jgi:hypothetical protein